MDSGRRDSNRHSFFAEFRGIPLLDRRVWFPCPGASRLRFNFRCDLTESPDTIDAGPSTGDSFARKHRDLHTGQFAA